MQNPAISFIYRLIFIITITSYSAFTQAAVPDIYKLRGPQSEFDTSHDYFTGLLERALTETEQEFGSWKIIYDTNLNQGREIKELQRGKLINIAMVGTNIEREKMLIAVHIPLVRGLLGNRIFIIRKDNQEQFDQVDTLDKLQRFTACQGKHWPDSDILEANGIPTIRNQDYESMFHQVQFKRCDYFPRGIHEGLAEMEAREEAYPDLMLYKKLALTYSFPMYFFVSPEYPRLAKRLESGLNKLVNSGELERYMQQHSTTKPLFPLEKWRDTLEIRLENPFLPEATPIEKTELWMKLPFRQPDFEAN